MSDKKTIGELIDKVLDDSEKKPFGERIDEGLGNNEKKIVEDHVDAVKDDVADTAHDISKSAKKAADVTQIAMHPYKQLWGRAEQEIRKD